jgi:hypothetical protein
MAFIFELIVLLLLGVLALAGAVVFLSFGQEESKRVSKSIDEQARNETYKKRYQPYREAGTFVASGLGSLLRAYFTPYSLLLVCTFAVALGITLIAVSVIMLNVASVVYFPFVALALPLFPLGLFTVLSQALHTSPPSASAMSFQLLAGWLTYILLYVLGARTKNRFLFILIYLLFLMLLFMNVAGCIQDAAPVCPNGRC